MLGLILGIGVGLSLGLLGGGGSILAVPLFVYAFGLPAREAVASSLAVVAVASLAGALDHGRAGNVDLRVGAWFAVFGAIGAAVGARIGTRMDGDLVLVLFAATMLVTAAAMWRGRGRSPAAGARPAAAASLALRGGLVGLLTGVLGAGGGFLIVPALALSAGLPMPTAVGTSLAVIAANALSGFAGYLGHAALDAGRVAGVSACAGAGALVGARVARRLDPSSLRRGFALFVAAVGLAMGIGHGAVIAEAASPWPGTFAMPWLVGAVGLGLGLRLGRRRAAAPPAARDREFVSAGAGI